MSKTSVEMTDAPQARRTLGRRAVDWVDLQYSVTRETLASLAPLARGELLDVGCGDLQWEPLFTPFVTRYVGVEHEASFAATHAGSARARRPDVLYDGGRLPFDDASFDTVLSIQVLEHTAEPAALVREMARVLRPKGLLLLLAPFSFRLHEEPHDYFRFSPHGLRKLVGDAGLEVTSVEPQGGLFRLLGHKAITFLGLRVLRVGRAAQALGKLQHERAEERAPRWWALPLVGPAMVATAASARVLDRVAPEPSDTLGYALVAYKLGA